MKYDSSWFGSPAIFLPQRQVFTQFDEGATFRPPRHLIAQRLMIEFIRIMLPLTCFIALASLLISFAVDMSSELEWPLWRIALWFPILYLGFGLTTLGVCVALKWFVVGRYHSIERPLWSRFVWRSELVTSTYENLAVPFFTNMLKGTPYINWCLRFLGAKIGKRVFMDTTDITEFDMVNVGKDAALNFECGLQTHLFEDRVMKVSRIEIGDRATVGSLAIVLYDSTMENDTALGSLSMLMKGETLPAGTRWEGSPAQSIA